jgi:hypothetical protein
MLNILLKTKCQKECQTSVNINVKNLHVEKNVKMVSKEMLNIFLLKIYRNMCQNQHPFLVVVWKGEGED